MRQQRLAPLVAGPLLRPTPMVASRLMAKITCRCCDTEMVRRGITSWSESAMQWETNYVCPDCCAGRLVSTAGNAPDHHLRHDWKTYPKVIPRR